MTSSSLGHATVAGHRGDGSHTLPYTPIRVLSMYGSLDMNLKWSDTLKRHPAALPCLFIWGGGDFGSPQRLQLVPLLQFSQFPPDFVEEVGALEAAAVAVEADDDGAEAADQDRGPVHPELLRHHLATRGAVTENTRSAG